ncbi:uncharacterized protein B0P05DRAFT_528775 [Gilbertella persicaria]|uniref:uncharacterized protein n=1 Tax=Gilbertella persicaria TaxID=101096 RepID=UPI00221F8E73|nr:uncharacterized protein B0P05DRAFT_528775 [Gilbertella persicaria]KAI8091094.1 hypothetical protein B0P05DRAFT_528775 [Gilbertella persicaria]
MCKIILFFFFFFFFILFYSIMGQSPSSAVSRHDNASTRTLHSSSMHSSQPTSFFRRISNRLHATHPARRFIRPRQNTTRPQQTSPPNTTHYHAPSTTSSVRRATQEATQAAAAVTGPPQPYLVHENSVTSSSDSTHTFLSELLHNASREDHQRTSGNSFLRYLQLPLRAPQQQEHEPTQSSASSTTSRRMHILVIEYRPHTNIDVDTTPLTPPPTYRFMGGLRRPRSQVSTSSSTDTIQSMPLSMNSTTTTHARSFHSQQQDGQWIVYVLNNNHPNFQLLSSSVVLEDNPSYEDLLWLGNMLGPVRPLTTTQAAVDEAIPVTDWSDDTKKSLKDDQCLVCLDEFKLKQSVRILKCHHVFHRECVDRWLCEAHNSCPVCRRIPV